MSVVTGGPSPDTDDWHNGYNAGLAAGRAEATALREALAAVLSEPTFEMRTFASRRLYEKALRSSTHEVTATAQLLRVLLPQIEAEAVTVAIRSFLAAPQPSPATEETADLVAWAIKTDREKRGETALREADPQPSPVPPETLDVERLADDVRYAGGNGTSDYWRGFNDGIDALAARLSEPRAEE